MLEMGIRTGAMLPGEVAKQTGLPRTSIEPILKRLMPPVEQAIKDAQSGRLGGLSERPGNASKFKLDLIAQIPAGEAISYFQNTRR